MMRIMNNRLKQIRIALNMQQGEFAKKINILQQQLSKYERGENKPSADFYIKLVENAKVNLNWLFTGSGEMFENPNKKMPDAVEIIYLENPRLMSTIKNDDISSIWMDRELMYQVWRKNEKDLRIIKMPGDYMSGGSYGIQNGDILIIDLNSTNILCSGVYAYTTKGDSFIFVKGIQQLPDGSIRFYPYNDSYKEDIYTPEQVSKMNLNVIGRVFKNATRFEK